MADNVLIVSRRSSKDFGVLAAQLPPEELNSVGATVLKTLLESGANLHATLQLLKRRTRIVSRELDVPTPLVIGGNRG